MIERIKAFLKGLSFRTGVIVLLLCIPCYVLSFVQMTFDFLSPEAKGVWFVVFFGLAKLFQYSGLLILGAEGIRRLKAKFRKKRKNEAEEESSGIE
ncbi:MAG: hypothetical protein J6Y82_08775 [Bacteroidales bacterium]|nr:hypothetical protein [Bacteroidales bacterium]